jgi:preprotein translocase subunit YajC
MSNQNSNFISFLLFYIILFFALYLLLIFPQQREKRKKERMINSLKRGDRVITTSGIIGEITIVGDDYFVIESEGRPIRVKKWAINEVLK